MVEIERVIRQTGEQAFLRADKGKGIEEVAFMDGFSLAVVGEEAVLLCYFRNGHAVS